MIEKELGSEKGVRPLMIERLLELQQRIYQYQMDIKQSYGPEHAIWSPGKDAKVSFAQVGDQYELMFYGVGFDEDPSIAADDFDYETNYPFVKFLEFICLPEVAPHLASLTFTGPDEGANGLNEWNFSRIVHSEAEFSALRSFLIQLTDSGDHNVRFIGSDYEEEHGMVTKLLAKMPAVLIFQTPTVPDEAFFAIEGHPLRELRLQVGFTEEAFITRLADCPYYTELRQLDFSERIETIDDVPEDAIPYTSYEALFASGRFKRQPHFHFKLRHSTLTLDEVIALGKLQPNVQFLFIEGRGGRYASHLSD
ncbi:hypothetical protein BBD42_13375 [Paenibacillus sp. BIHB 4019]|uniref:Uncharacterized protein n=2 Tax=Paenibacillus sp. BIHB 4019 TaxID=1870819 RepID=A0A1B2DI51_9BACL|nr:hypothetical protein BBD42_13375 [Paenibacillus sp. BIHB 4019]